MSDVNAVAVVSYILTDGTKGYYELPAESLEAAQRETRALFARFVADGEEEYDVATLSAKWDVPSNWLGF